MIVNTTAAPKGKKETRCCIDLGSSYFRLLSVDVESGRGGMRFGNVVEERVYVGWGEEVSASGSISHASAGRAALILRRLSEMGRGPSDARLTVVATNALRRAANRDGIRSLIEDRTGLGINVLSHRGEAFLGFAGAALDLRRGEPAVLADTGGTSTELAWGEAPAADSFISIPVGTHTVLASAGYNGRIAASRIALALGAAGIRPGDSLLPGRRESPTIMFTGGTAVSLAVVWKRMRPEGNGFPGPAETATGPVCMTSEDLNLIGRRLTALFRSGRDRTIPLPPERVRLLLPGLAIVRETARALRAEELNITARDLRWGVVLGNGTIERGYLADEQESPDSR